MPLCKLSNNNLLWSRQNVITTTVFSSPSVSPHTSQSNTTRIPIAAIAGGAAGGMVLAVLAVVGWIWWGRSIKQQQQRALLTRTRGVYSKPAIKNTRPSISSSRPRGRTASANGKAEPSPGLVNEKRVTFAAPQPTSPMDKVKSNHSDTTVSSQISVPKIQRPLLAQSKEGEKHSEPKEVPQFRRPRTYSPRRPSPLARSWNLRTPAVSTMPQPWSRLLGIGGDSSTDRNGKNTRWNSPELESNSTGNARRVKSTLARAQIQARPGETNRTSFMTATSASIYSDHGPEPVGVAYGGEDYDNDTREEDHDYGVVQDLAPTLEDLSRYLDFADGR